MRRPHLRALIALLVAAVRVQAAHAETINVPCDSRALTDAIAIANANAEEDDLWLAPGCVYAPTAQLAIEAGHPLTIYGRGATVSGSDTHRVFEVPAGAALDLDQVTVLDGESDDFGGGIWNRGSLTLAGSAVLGNSAFFGGGILNTGTLRLVRSTVSGNDAGVGGGIVHSGGSGALINSTVSGNQAATSYGGGIRVDSGELTLSHVTVFNNSASLSGGGIYVFSGELKLDNSILADGTGGDCVAYPGSVIAPSGGNLIEDGSCGGVGALSGDPLLGDLVGSPGYHPLLKKSPAIDAADGASCPSIDQRGALRPQDGNRDKVATCDLGAYEMAKKKKGKK